MRVLLKVQPRSSSNEVEREADGSLRVRVTARPEKGKANEAVLRMVAEHFRVKRSAVALVSGATSRRKVVEVQASRV